MRIHAHPARAVALAAAVLGLVSSPSPSRGGVPQPNRSKVVLSAPTAPCQYRFRADGGYPLTLFVTIRDAFDTPVPNVAVNATASAAGGAVFCSCEPLVMGGLTDAIGFVPIVFSHVGGHGTLDLAVTAAVNIPIWEGSIEFTSPDLNGSCEPVDATNIFDLGYWAGGLPPGYWIPSDYDCDGAVDVFDLGVFAEGLGLGCSP